jgi:hypothetical protein
MELLRGHIEPGRNYDVRTGKTEITPPEFKRVRRIRQKRGLDVRSDTDGGEIVTGQWWDSLRIAGSKRASSFNSSGRNQCQCKQRCISAEIYCLQDWYICSL